MPLAADSVPAQILSYNRANRAVAVLCNHQVGPCPPPTWVHTSPMWVHTPSHTWVHTLPNASQRRMLRKVVLVLSSLVLVLVVGVLCSALVLRVHDVCGS